MLSCLQLLPVQPELPGAGLGRVQGGLQHHLHQHLGRIAQGGVGEGVGYTTLYNMVFYTTIGSTYFVKTQTYVALFCPHELSIIFSGVLYLDLSPL